MHKESSHLPFTINHLSLFLVSQLNFYMDNVNEKVAVWLKGNYDQATKDEITRLQKEKQIGRAHV